MRKKNFFSLVFAFAILFSVNFFLVSCDDDSNEEVMFEGIGVGAGYDFDFGLGVFARYNLGLSNISDFESEEGDDDYSLKNKVFQIGLSYAF